VIGCRLGDGRGAVPGPHTLGTVGRGGLPAVAPEGFRELRRLPVSDPRGDLANGWGAAGKQLGGTVHAHARQVLAEGRVADLGEHALDLTPRGRYAAGDLVELEVARVLVVNNPRRFLIQAPSQGFCGGALKGHVRGEVREAGAQGCRAGKSGALPLASAVSEQSRRPGRIEPIVASGPLEGA